MSESVEKLLEAQLNKDLPKLSGQNRDRVCRVILGRDVDCQIDTLAESLLASGISVGHLLAAMLRCEWISMQQLIAHAKPEHMKQQVKLFSGCIEHFNALQEAIVTAADNSWRTTLDIERKSRVVAECRSLWSEKKVVHLHNYFEEMPVNARVDYLGFEENRLRVKMTPELARVFAATLNMNTALITNPENDYNLVMKLDHYGKGVLSLLVSSIEQSGRGRRRDIRVKLSESVVALMECQGRKLNTEIVDISCSGLGLALNKDHQLVMGDKILCQFQLGDKKVDHVEGKVCWVMDFNGLPRAGIQFKKGNVKRELIYRFLFVQEQRIITRLRRLHEPDWMRGKG